MDATTFFDNFGAIADAPGGVQKLRRLVLDLAVNGRLVRQDAVEQPAAADLELFAERAVNLKTISGRSRRTPDGKTAPPGATLPTGWAEASLGNAFLVVMGNSPPGDSYNELGEGVPLINGPVEFSAPPLGRTLLRQFTTRPTRLCEEGDLLVCVRGATTGRTNIAGFDACIGRGVALVRAWEAQPFINLVMWNLGSQLLAAGKGTTFPSVSQDDLANLRVLIPPLAEQNRIVAKVSKLMGLCDELEVSQLHCRRAAARFQGSTLNALAETNEPDLRRAWYQVNANWPGVTTDPAAIRQIQNAVLELAMRGRLAVPRAGDTPTPFEDGRAPGGEQTPDLWAWADLGDLLEAPLVNGRSVPTRDDGFPVLRLTCLRRSGRIDLAERKGGAWTDEDARPYRVRVGDFLVARGNGSLNLVGRGALVVDTPDPVAFPDTLIRVRIDSSLLKPDLLPLWWNSPLVRRQLEPAARTTSGLFKVSQALISRVRLPIPPVEMQDRIIVAVERIMRLCEDLDVRLVEQSHRANCLAAGFVHAASSGVESNKLTA